MTHMSDAVPLEDAPNEAGTIEAGWRPLPPRAKKMFAISHALFALMIALPLSFVALISGRLGFAIAVVVLAALAILIGTRIGVRRFRSTAWRLDADGFAYRRGRVFFRETRVPASRVQHLDLKHGPLERRWKLATLIIHTAGSKMSAVSVSGLDQDDAEHLRDRLSRLLDEDDDAL
jgi:membrane protein YdbS with pleckstrin-like domain